MEFSRAPRKRVTISLIPLIDITIFLLIFFMLSGTVEKFELIPVDPPVAQSGKLMDEGHLTILLGRHDEVIIEDEIVDIKNIPSLLGPQLAQNPNKVITVKADATVSANRAIEVMDTIKAAGGRNLSIITQSKVPMYAE